MKKRRRAAGFLCAALVGIMALSGCGAPEEEYVIKEPNLPKNDGQPAVLTIGLNGYTGEDKETFESEIEKIIEKYEADYPNTEIRLAEDGGRPDIGLFSSDKTGEQDTGWLMDMTPYAEAWSEEGNISNAARLIMRFRGGDTVYAVPCRYEQMMLYYRVDWINEYNNNYYGIPDEQVGVDTWEKLFRMADRLGDKGRLTISDEVREHLFDSILWSTLGTGGIADLPSGYYQGDGSTVFTLDAAKEAAELTKQVLDLAEDSGDPMEEFISGRVGIYIGTGSDMLKLRDQNPGERGPVWNAAGLPRANGGRIEPLLGWTAWGINKDSEEPEKAVHFLAYLTNADNNTHMYMELLEDGVKPIYRETEVYEPSLKDSCWTMEIELINTSGYRYASAPLMFGGNVGTKNPVFKEAFGQLEAGDITPGEMLTELDGEYSRLMEEYLGKNGMLPWETEVTEEEQ